MAHLGSTNENLLALKSKAGRLFVSLMDHKRSWRLAYDTEMPKRTLQTHSRYALEAITLLGRQIRLGRIELKLTAQDLAARAGISRALLYRIEAGDAACSIGAVFEAASIVGVRLFEEEGAVTGRLRQAERELTLLPKAVRAPRKAVQDDF